MKLLSSADTDHGLVRKNNEDAFLAVPDLGLYVVCDGMGGHSFGEEASQKAIKVLEEHVRNAASVSEIQERVSILQKAVEAANAAIHAVGKEDRTRKGMGTTCTAFWQSGEKAVVAHVGDTRLYLVRNSAVHRITADHTFVEEALRSGSLKPEDAKNVPFQHLLTRALGPMPYVKVDTLVVDLLPDDLWILCSDGVHGQLESDSELVGICEKNKPEELAIQLRELANQRGGPDNATSVILWIPKEVQASGRARSKTLQKTFETLKVLELFRDLDFSELQRVIHHGRTKTLAANQSFIEEGEDGESLFILVEGRASVERDGKLLAFLEAGMHVGEMAVLSKRPRTATVTTVEVSTLLEFHRNDLLRFVREEPSIAAKFLWRLAQGLSLRLDDLYFIRENDRSGNETMTDGSKPSPFDRWKSK